MSTALPDLTGRIGALIAAIDRAVARQLDVILHDASFRRVEAAWRGLHALAHAGADMREVKLRLLPVTWAELARDFDRAADFESSSTFRKIYTDEFGTPGGEPFGLLVVDHEVGHRATPEHPQDDIAVLRGLAQVAAAAFAPVLVGTRPALFGLDEHSELSLPIDLAALFRQSEYGPWRSFQQLDEARFVGIVLPRVLLREPHRWETARAPTFPYDEDPATAAGGLWGNAAFAFARVAMRAFADHGWFADIRGTLPDVLGGGLVTDLPQSGFATDAPRVAGRFATEVAFPERQERELSELGFMPLAAIRMTPFAAFHFTQSAGLSARFDTPEATMSARLSSMLQYVLSVSRFAHYIKVMGRDRVGSYTSADQCELAVQRWLNAHTSGNDDASPETKARYPLRDARAVVRDVPGRVGAYYCTVQLQPHFQVDEIVSTFRLTTVLSPAAPA
ncbi:MAG: type VI secretion system contractile sheath large subunit [Alphaproteobacteria bacterium]|nr:type VI secretion system contractile sheath large subunit [Alphaproteobacteria bacterium]